MTTGPVMVSVIIPIYNTEEYLMRSIESVLSQTYENIEIILVDDCSPDNSEVVYRKAMEENTNIKLIRHNHNMGVMEARNTGIKAATGEYIMFLDSDDILYPDAICSMVSAAETNKTDIVFATFNRNRDGKITTEFQNVLSSQKYAVSDFLSYLFVKLPLNVLSCIGTKLYRLSVFELNGILFNTEYKYNEDLAIVIDFVQHVENVSYIDIPVYEYDIRTCGSSQSSYRPNLVSNLYKTRIKLDQLLKKYSIFSKLEKHIDNMWLDIVLEAFVQEYQFTRSIDKSFLETMGNSDVVSRINNAQPTDLKRKVFRRLLLLNNKVLIKMLLKVWIYLTRRY